jgi:UDP-glucose 4-epimerase
MTLPFKKILVVGGGGFIGQTLIAKLHAMGECDIVAVGRSPQPKFPLPAAINYQSGDITHAKFIEPLVAWADAVIDLAYATTPKTSFDDPVYDVISNLPPSVSLQRVASEHDVGMYLLVSSGGTVYGRPARLPIDESHSNNPISPYGISKLVTEKYAEFFHQMKKLPAVIARPGNAYGPGQFGPNPQGFIGVAMYAILNKHPIEIYGERGTIRDYIYVQDLADGLIAILQNGVIGETYNLGSGVGNDNVVVLDLLRQVIGVEHKLNVIYHPLRPFDVSANVLDSKRIFRDTGWRSKTDLKQGIQETWEQVLKNMKG